MLSYNTVEPHTLELLKELAKHPLLSEMRLVGGTALALQYGHRNSVDLDFFGALNGDIEDFDDLIASFDSVTRIKETSKIRIYNINGVKVDFVDYSRYEWITPAVEEDGIRLASPSDIAAMKINAIEGRGSKKDFIDIYQLLQHYTLSDILEFYKQKYPEHNIFRALMSLSYFDDAEQQPMPKIFNNVSWENIKKTVSANVKQLSI
ncbi:MAG: nucleotidyl transferase AbiEii/AbiGii toxin family protein [Prevotella sp.]|nr:nucleotidyl transferase AbiEii/AbiGii toxin family protein [Prevotella sp.]